ncbi:MAG: thioredoxin domain-containing protein [Candidatus Woesearchaeota archaeon]
MVLCFIALPVFAILGIFSLKYRKLALESLDCMFRTVTFRKCRSGLDDRIKSRITGKMMKHSPHAAKFIYRNYKLFSWIILLILIWSTYESGIGVYNYVQYGNCNGPESTGFCMLDPTGAYSGISETNFDMPAHSLTPVVEDNDPIIGNPDAELTIIEFGCYTCPFSKKAEPNVAEVLEYYDGRVNLQFKNFPIPSHAYSPEIAYAADCAFLQGKYKPYHDKIFELQGTLGNQDLINIASELGLDIEKFKSCMTAETTEFEVAMDTHMGVEAGVIGTPTFFIGDKRIIGPKPFKTFKNIIDEQLR